MKKSFIGGIFLTVALFNFLVLTVQAQTIEISNPLKYGTFDELIKAILVFARDGAGVAAALMVLLAGYDFVYSGGDPTKLGNAKKKILYALIGLLVILLAEALVLLVQGAIGNK